MLYSLRIRQNSNGRDRGNRALAELSSRARREKDVIHIIRYISVNSSKIYESREGIVCENVVNLIILCFIFIFCFQLFIVRGF